MQTEISDTVAIPRVVLCSIGFMDTANLLSDHEWRALCRHNLAPYWGNHTIGTPEPANQGTRAPRSGNKREALIELIRQGDGLSRGEILQRMGIKGDKSGEMSVSNALTALTKSNQVHRKDRKYYVNVPTSAGGAVDTGQQIKGLTYERVLSLVPETGISESALYFALEEGGGFAKRDIKGVIGRMAKRGKYLANRDGSYFRTQQTDGNTTGQVTGSTVTQNQETRTLVPA